MTTPKPTRGSVGPGTLDQELQEHKGLHQNRITSKGPSDFQGNQKANVTAAKGLLPHKDHRGPGAKGAPSCRSHKGLLQKVQGLLEPQGLQQPQGTNRRPPEDQGAKGNSQGLLPTRWGLGPKTRCRETPRARSRDYSRRVTSLCHVNLRPGRSRLQTGTIQIKPHYKRLYGRAESGRETNCTQARRIGPCALRPSHF